MIRSYLTNRNYKRWKCKKVPMWRIIRKTYSRLRVVKYLNRRFIISKVDGKIMKWM